MNALVARVNDEARCELHHVEVLEAGVFGLRHASPALLLLYHFPCGTLSASTHADR